MKRLPKVGNETKINFVIYQGDHVADEIVN